MSVIQHAINQEIIRLQDYISELEESIENTLRDINSQKRSKQWKNAINVDLKDMHEQLKLAKEILRYFNRITLR